MQSKGTLLFHVATPCPACFFPWVKWNTHMPWAQQQRAFPCGIVLLIVFFYFYSASARLSLKTVLPFTLFPPVFFRSYPFRRSARWASPTQPGWRPSALAPRARGLAASCRSLAFALHKLSNTSKPFSCCVSGDITIISDWCSEQTKFLYYDLSSHAACQFYEFLK